MSINHWGWRSRERSMAYYLAHPNAIDPDEPIPAYCPRCNGSGEETFRETDKGPDGEEFTDSCSHCLGTGEAP